MRRRPTPGLLDERGAFSTVSRVQTRLIAFLLCTSACLHAPEAPRDTAPAAATCGRFETTATPTPVALLGGRLTVALPRGARSLWPATFHTTIDVGNRDGQVLIVSALETHGLVPADLEAWAKSQAKGARVETRRLGGPLVGVIVEPGAQTAPELLGRAWVPTPDGTVAVVDLFVRGVPEPQQRCREFARHVFSTLRHGAARFEQSGARHHIGPWLELDTPPGYVVERTTTSEASTLTIVKLRPLGTRNARLTITSTEHPPNIGMPVDRAGPYLGKTVSWRNGYTDGIETRTAILRIPSHVEYAYSRAEAPTMPELDELMAIAGAIRVVSP